MTTNQTRPYWHVDLKWIFGILTTFFLSLFLLLYTLATLTSEKTAIPLATIIVAGQFSKNGLDDATDIEIVKKKFLNSRENVFYPLENQNVSITRSELETLSPRELRLKIFRQVVEPFYYEQIDEKTKKQAGILAFLNQTTHRIIDQIVVISFIPLLVCLFGLIFFSYRYGRLVSPAVIFLLVSLLPTVLLTIVANARGGNGPFSFLPNDVTQQIAVKLALPYQIFFFAGIGLLGTVVIIKLTDKLRRENTL
jgi:hypothetical protein